MIRRRPRPGQEGFTLIELTVALVAGLIVVLAIVALSKAATTTFHEEMRSSAAEATLRTAVDRLRADLNRAAFMSTANVLRDPSVTTIVNTPANFATFAGIARLAGIRLQEGGSHTLANSALQTPALTPDAVEISGNMTSVEQFDVQTINAATGTGCTRITISANSPALYRIGALGGAMPVAAALGNLFQPYAPAQFIVRIVDDSGCSQFVPTCPENPPAGFDGTNWWVDTDSAVKILSPADTGTRCGLNPMPGHAKINAVQTVRWEIIDAPSEPAQYQTALARTSASTVADATKYDLIRTFVGADGQPIPASTEVVAEYAVDLDFAFSVENGVYVVGANVTGAPALITFAFDDPNNALWADLNAANLTNPTNRPERIRVVRARIATRTALPDRTVNVPGPAGSALPAFLYRYCMNSQGCTTNDGTAQWARMRTMTTEVALHNQAGALYN